MAQYIEALFEDGVFQPREQVDLASGTRVRVELREARQPTVRDDLADVEAVYERIDRKYPSANVRGVYGDRSELHDR